MVEDGVLFVAHGWGPYVKKKWYSPFLCHVTPDTSKHTIICYAHGYHCRPQHVWQCNWSLLMLLVGWAVSIIDIVVPNCWGVFGSLSWLCDRYQAVEMLLWQPKPSEHSIAINVSGGAGGLPPIAASGPSGQASCNTAAEQVGADRDSAVVTSHELHAWWLQHNNSSMINAVSQQ